MKKYFKKQKLTAKIVIVLGVIIFLLFSVFCFQYLSKLITTKKIEREKYFNYKIAVKTTNFMITNSQARQALKNSQDDFVGVGIAFSLHSNIIFISEVIDGSPADKVGLKPHDKIAKINDKYVLDMTEEDIYAELTGEKGKKVKLTIYRNSDDSFKDFIVILDLVDNSKRRSFLAFLEQGIGGQDLGNNYKKYENKIYYWDNDAKNTSSEMIRININENEIETLNGGCTWDNNKYDYTPCDHFAKDTQKVYYKSSWIRGADPETFELMEKRNEINFSKDKNSIFYKGVKIEDADVESFEIVYNKYCPEVSSSLSKDKNNYYRAGRKITSDEFIGIVDSMDNKCFLSNSDEWNIFSEWKLISGDPQNSCSRPKYSGEVSIRGWYEWKTNYTSKQWVLHVYPEDKEKLIDGYKGFYSLINVSDSLAEKLKEANKENPVSITVKELGYYCEGLPWLEL